MRRLGTIALAAMMGLGTLAPGFSQPAPTVTANVPAKRKKGLFNRMASPSTAYPHSYKSKECVTMAQQKRASVKARNVAKHRRHA